MSENIFVEKMIDEILQKEGGFINHKNDRGGPTNYGITQKTLSAWCGRKVTIIDVKNLRIETAREIYRQNYYLAPHINELPHPIQPIVFDCSINHGPKRAVKFVQTVLFKLGFPIQADGIIGPITIRGSLQAMDEMGNYFINAIVDERISYYKKIVENDKSQEVFLKGWLRRAESFMEEV